MLTDPPDIVSGTLPDRMYLCALWYAYGRNDATPDRQWDPLDFAVRHRAVALDFEAGRTFHLPSIQDAWSAYVGRS